MSVLPQRSSSLSNNDGGILRKGTRMPGPLAPNGAVIGDIWYDTTNKSLKVWNGTAWFEVGAEGAFANTTRFSEGVELYHPGITPYVDWHRAATPLGDAGADYNMRMILDGSEQISIYSSAGAQWGSLRVASTKIGSYGWDPNWATFGHKNRMDINSTSYQFMAHTDGAILINVTNAKEFEVRRDGGFHNGFWLGEGGNSDFVTQNVAFINRANQVRDDILSLGAWGDYLIGVRSQTLFLNTYDWISSDSRSGGATRTFDIHPDDGYYQRGGWFRANDDGGLYIQYDLWGLKGDGDFYGISENSEQRLTMHRISQGGYASAALESRGNNNSVPYVSFHAAGERAGAWRKDNGAWNMVWIDQNGNCNSVFGSGFGTCSDEARKTDISIMEGLGLKTIRGLEPKVYRYHPVTEDQIWATMMDRDERAEGKWKYRVGQQESWEQWHVGYMAEEIYNRFPLAAYLDPLDNRPWAIDYGRLVIAAISAINELADRVEELEGELESRSINAN